MTQNKMVLAVPAEINTSEKSWEEIKMERLKEEIWDVSATNQ